MVIPVYIICGIFALIGFLTLKVTKEDVQTANASKLWPSVHGKIIDVDFLASDNYIYQPTTITLTD